MSLSVLNNIPSLVAQNNLAVTNNNLKATLFELSSGSRINSGADDPAGLSIVNGLQANISALKQSSLNATNGVGQLQVADGALSQVTNLLNRAVTLATQAANGGLTGAQFSAVSNEYNSITAEINRIGQATNFNGTSVFQSATVASTNQVASTAKTAVAATTLLTAGQTSTVQMGNNTAYTYTAGAAATTLVGSSTGTTANTLIATGKTISIANSGGTVAFTANPLTYTAANATAVAAATAGLEGITVVNALGTTTFAAGAGASTAGAWLNGFNAAALAAGKGVSAALDGSNHLVITSTSGITSITPANAATTTLFGALTNNPKGLVGGTAVTNATVLTGTNESLSIVNAGGTTTYAGGATTVGAWVTAFNIAAGVAGFGVTASVNSSGYLQIASTTAITTTTPGTAFATGFGSLTSATDTVGDLMNQVNNSGFGMTATINAAGNFQVTSSNGPISVTNNNTNNTLGTMTATNTVQDLINGINGSGLGVTASVQTVTNLNQLGGGTGLTGATSLTGQTLRLTSGPQQANGSFANTFNYTGAVNTPDTVLGTAGNNTMQGLIDAINTSGMGFNAYLQGGALQIVDTNYNGNIAASGTVVTTTLTSVANPSLGQLQITDSQNRSSLHVTGNDTVLGFVAAPGGNPLEGGNANAFVAPAVTGSGGASVFISDGQVGGQFNTIAVPVGVLSATSIGGTATTVGTANLGTAVGAGAALSVINSAISSIAAMRGTIGAGINRLNSATNVINTQVQNLTSAQSSIQDADIGQVVANMSKFQVLEQTGISALAQSNQNEQAVLKLLQ